MGKIDNEVKRAVVKEMLEHGACLINLDPEHPGVVVPQHLRSGQTLGLRIGYNLTPHISDLEIGQTAITATLSFNGKPFHCTIPWGAMFAFFNNESDGRVIFPRSIPEKFKQKASEAVVPAKVWN